MKNTEKKLKERYDKFKKECISTYWEFKHLRRKLNRLVKQASKLAEGVGMLTEESECDPVLQFRLGDFPVMMVAALEDIDDTFYNIQHSSFKKALTWDMVKTRSMKRLSKKGVK